jgi:hypothetical protein
MVGVIPWRHLDACVPRPRRASGLSGSKIRTARLGEGEEVIAIYMFFRLIVDTGTPWVLESRARPRGARVKKFNKVSVSFRKAAHGRDVSRRPACARRNRLRCASRPC